jgi:tRNA(Ile)-lysidine synthase
MPVPKGLSDLSPWAAHLCLRTERFIRELASPDLPDMPDMAGGTLVLAVSGGLDSTAMAVMAKLLAPRLGVGLLAAHLDHMLREESGQDALFCRQLCDDLDIPLQAVSRGVKSLAAQWKTGIEDAGRRARYAWLEEVRESVGACAICLGHHLDDLAVDQLMRLIRGAGWPALGGMPAWDPRRRVLRPLLAIPKADLRRFLTELGITWREDESNADPAFTRNRVRLDILPFFARENPDYLHAAAELWKQARADEKHWNEAVLQANPQGGGTDWRFLENATLKASSQALRLRLYKRAVEALGPGQPLAAALHGLDEAWRNRATGKRFQFPGGKKALVTRDGVRFLPGPEPGVDTSGSGG